MATDLSNIIANVREKLTKRPDKAMVTFVSESDLKGVFHSQANVRDHTFSIDEPPAMGGDNAGPNPVELTLAALGSCQEMTFRVYATAMGIELTKVSATVEGDLDMRGLFGVDESVRPGLQGIRMNIHLESDADESQLQALRDAVEAHCPVLDIISNPVPVDVSFNAA